MPCKCAEKTIIQRLGGGDESRVRTTSQLRMGTAAATSTNVDGKPKAAKP